MLMLSLNLESHVTRPLSHGTIVDSFQFYKYLNRDISSGTFPEFWGPIHGICVYLQAMYFQFLPYPLHSLFLRHFLIFSAPSNQGCVYRVDYRHTQRVITIQNEQSVYEVQLLTTYPTPSRRTATCRLSTVVPDPGLYPVAVSYSYWRLLGGGVY